MAEICSTYPSAGSVYHWSGMMAPAATAPLASYITGWFNFLGNAAGDASFAYGFANLAAASRYIQNCPVDRESLFQARRAERLQEPRGKKSPCWVCSPRLRQRRG